MTVTTLPSAIDLLAGFHAHHAERIKVRGGSLQPGSIVTITRDGITDTASFFTGIKFGDRVVITDVRERDGEVIVTSVQRIEGESSHLSVNSGMTLTLVDPADWTEADAIAANRAAEQYATDQQTRALTLATGWGAYTKPEDGDQRALLALQTAAAAKHYAFALLAFRNAIKAVNQAQRDERFAKVLLSGAYVL